MLDKTESDRLDKFLKANLITGIQHKAVYGASEGEAVSIITTLIAEKVVMFMHEPASELTAIIKEAVIHRALEKSQSQCELSVAEIFDIWEKMLDIHGENHEYQVSIVLSQSTYNMICGFINSSETPELLNTVHPFISTVFIAEGINLHGRVLDELSKIPGLKLIYDPQEFIKKAEGSIVLCDNIDSGKPEIIDLVSDVLEKGIFLIAPEFGTMDLKTISAIANAIDKSPIPDGDGVLHLNGVLIHKPFNPTIRIGNECDRETVDMPSGMKMSELDLLNMLGEHHV